MYNNLIDFIKVKNNLLKSKEKSFDGCEERYTVLKEMFLYNYREAKSRDFIIDKYNEQVFIDVLNYFSYSPKFIRKIEIPEISEYSFDRGIHLKGVWGLGKSELMYNMAFTLQRLSEYEKREGLDNFFGSQCFEIVSAKTSVEQYSVLGFSYFEKFNNSKNLLIDDLGKDSETSNYKNTINPVEQIIHNKYEMMKKNSDVRIHYTSNFGKSQLALKYDPFIVERIMESSNIILYPENAKSRRPNT